MNPEKILEALLFAADSPLRAEALLEIFQHEDFTGMPDNVADITLLLEDLVQKYAAGDTVFEVRRIDQGYQLFTRREYYPYVRHMTLHKHKRKLSRASLETLAIIAYRQPVSKPEIEFIRGVNCDYALRKLLDKSLVEIRGRSDAAGRPLLYGTTRYFMEYFSLNDLRDLPKLAELAVDEDAYQAQFKVYLEGQEQAPPPKEEHDETAG